MNPENVDTAILDEIEAFSVQIARKAGHILLEYFNKPLEISYKSEKNTDPVTVADRVSEEYLKQTIKEKFPEHSILSEEEGISSQNSSPFTWVLDPLDGTANFINGLPFFAVSIGVLWRNIPVAGSIYVPVSHKTTEGVYHGFLGNGAYFNDEKITVSTESPRQSLVEMPPQFRSTFRFSGKSSKEPYDIRNLGSIALELAMTACGVFQFALFNRPKLWDVLPGIVLVKEAGGLAVTYEKKSKDWKYLREFGTEKSEISTPHEVFHSWSSPLIAGTPDTVNKVIHDLRVHHTFPDWINMLRLRYKKRLWETGENDSLKRKS
ncbi:MAG: inositol monophosphatase [Dehalococcoidales bacterium]|nr:MAG: inositol monophosphatase [Dehalococcoidales bacterium]